jgi:predicted nucleic acid-binding protein
MFLLDTNIISELRKSQANSSVVMWANRVPPASLYLSSITILELETGILRIERRDQPQGARLRNWLQHYVLPAFEGRILPVDRVVAIRCAQLHVPDPRSEYDALIAATALVHGMSVVTRNTDDFRGSGVKVLNPFVSQLNEEAGQYSVGRQ